MRMQTVSQVLLEDRDLLDAIPTAVRVRAVQECIAPVVRINRGRWNGDRPDLGEDALGLLVLEGLLVRRVGIDGRFGAELLGDGDILRPWQGEDAQPTIPHTTGWPVIEPTRVAALDARVMQAFSRYPRLMGRLVGRALERSRKLAANMASFTSPASRYACSCCSGISPIAGAGCELTVFWFRPALRIPCSRISSRRVGRRSPCRSRSSPSAAWFGRSETTG